MDGEHVGVVKETDKVRLGRLLERQDGRRPEAQVGLEILGDLTDKALEGQLAHQQVGGLLVLADLAKGDRSRAVAMGLFLLLDSSSSGGGGITSGIDSKSLTRGLAAGRLARCGLLGSGHLEMMIDTNANIYMLVFY